MIPLAQYLTEQDGDFQSFAPRKPKRGNDFTSVGTKRSRPAPDNSFEKLGKAPSESGFPQVVAANEDDIGIDTEALFQGMESELRERATPREPVQDARALQNDLVAKAGRLSPSGALENVRKTAYDEGHADATAAAEVDREAAIELALQEERAAAELRQAEAIEAARAEWTKVESERLADALAEQTERLGDAMRMTLSSILRPLAINTRQRQSVEEVAQSIAQLSYDGQAMSMKAFGPEDLLEQLRTALGDRAPQMTFVPSDEAVDVKIEIGQTILQSRLGEWRAALETALS